MARHRSIRENADMRYESTVLRPRTQDLTGQPFGRLKVIGFAGYAHSNAYWTCQCDCGIIKTIVASNLVGEKTRSCGCLRREATKSRRTTHGKRHTPEYRTWHHMLDRCENHTDAAYARYGGRGIYVCEAWHDFSTFYADMGIKPGAQYSLERRDNNGPYAPENCYWATDLQQARNKRNNHFLTLFGVTKCLSEWALLTGHRPDTIAYRLKLGFSDEKALLTPSRRVPTINPQQLLTALHAN
jgi:hypothetical protein